MLDKAAFARLCDENRERLLAVTSRIVGSDAEDVVQEAFEAAWKHRDSFRGTAAPATWLHRVAVNCALMRLRSGRRSRIDLVEDVSMNASSLPSPEECASAKEGSDAAERAVRDLPVLDRRILELRLVEERTSEEVAALVGMSTVAVRTRLHRARARVATALSGSVSASALAMAAVLVTVSVVGAGCSGGGDQTPNIPEQIAGACRNYTNPFSGEPECREYLGPWQEKAAAADCDDAGGDFSADATCDLDASVGACLLQGNTATPTRVAFLSKTCGENQRGCELFGGGHFLEEGACGPDKPKAPDVLSDPFPEPELSCVEPLPGDAAGAGEGGKVCQWITMQGCTEEGRTWEEYGSCDIPREQRPNYPVVTAPDAERDDPRLADPAYAAELTWVKSQLASCSCSCCHSVTSPDGPSNWYLEQPGNFVNGMFDTGIAMGAGVTDSRVLGNLDAADNNGFTRLPSVFPSTDPARMQAFFQAEFLHRGLRAEDFPADGNFGPLTDQDVFVPQACDDGVGVVDGVVQWSTGGARIVYVLAAGSENPGVPPDLDDPDGTLWRIDAVDPTTALIEPGVRYGEVPEIAVQRTPASAPPAALVSGRAYTLFVDADYLQPIERCVFTAQ